MPSKPTTVKQYLAALPADRRKTIQAIREVILANLDTEFQEGIQYDMIGYFVPHSVYPAGYHCDTSQPLPFASIGNQKNHIGLYLFCLYFNEAEKDRFVDAWKKTGKKLDMGKSCVRVKKLEDIPLEAVGKAIKRFTVKKYIKIYEGVVGERSKPASKKPAKKTSQMARKKVAKKKTAK